MQLKEHELKDGEDNFMGIQKSVLRFMIEVSYIKEIESFIMSQEIKFGWRT